MKPKHIWANYAVADLERTTRFYTQLGFAPNGKPNKDLTSFLFGDNGFVIHFFLKDVLEPNMKGAITDAQVSNEIIFTISAGSVWEANEWAKEIALAGGKLITQPAAFGAGYYGFVFADPDGHRFNVFYMDGM